MGRFGQPVAWSQQVPGPQQCGDQEQRPDRQSCRKRQDRQRRHQPREGRRRDERLRVELRSQAEDRLPLSRKVVQAPVTVAKTHERGGISETEVVGNRVLADEQRRGDDQVPAREHRPDQQAGKVPAGVDGGRRRMRRTGAVRCPSNSLLWIPCEKQRDRRQPHERAVAGLVGGRRTAVWLAGGDEFLQRLMHC